MTAGLPDNEPVGSDWTLLALNNIQSPMGGKVDMFYTHNNREMLALTLIPEGVWEEANRPNL